MRSLYKIVFLLTASVLLMRCSREKIVGPENDFIAPLTPGNLRVFAAFDGQVGLEWGKNDEPDLKGYYIYRSINNEDHFERISLTETNYFTEKSLFYDSTYYYKISAVNRNDLESPLTSSVFARPVNIYTPLVPRRLEINARNWTDHLEIRLTWEPPTDTDIQGYRIYRSTSSGFTADSLHYLDFTPGISYSDTKQIKLLTNYHYKIIAVDKGGLTSDETSEVYDMALNSPRLVFPADKSVINSLREFRFVTVSDSARYKLVISSNELYGTIMEINFSSGKIDQEIGVSVTGLQLDQFRTYYWRIYAYTSSEVDPNSYSALSAFTYYPSN